MYTEQSASAPVPGGGGGKKAVIVANLIKDWDMAVKVMIRRRIDSRHVSQLRAFLTTLEEWAFKHSGYFYGEHLENPRQPGEILYIGTWRSIEAFDQWSCSLPCRQLENKMAMEFGMQSESTIYIRHAH